MQVRFLQEGARVHKSELEWQSLKLQHQAEQELDRLRGRHSAFEKDLQRSMDDLTCALHTCGQSRARLRPCGLVLCDHILSLQVHLQSTSGAATHAAGFAALPPLMFGKPLQHNVMR